MSAVIEIGGLIPTVSGGLVFGVPGSGTTFDFYVSPTGSDTNAGTVAAPWAITSCIMTAKNANNVANFNSMHGKRVGFLPGTYNVSTYMDATSGGYSGAIQIDGGTSAASTYYGSSNSSGNYQQGTATITALTGGGAGGGGLNFPDNGPILMGCMATPHTGGWVTIDGLTFTGYSFKGIRIGGYTTQDTSHPKITGDVIVQNCTFTGQTFNGTSGNANDNAASIYMCGTATIAAGGTGNYIIRNNYFFNNTIGTDTQHLASIFCFDCALVQILQNTCINAGTFAWGKDSANQGVTCAYNYIDNTAFASGVSANGVYVFSDWTGDYQTTSGTLTLTSNFHHNVCVTNGWGIALDARQNFQTWQTPVNVYNNTIVGVSGGQMYPMIWAVSRNVSQVSIYNNIMTGAADVSGYKHLVTGTTSINLVDYNGEPSTTMTWGITPQGEAGGVPSSTYSTVGTYNTGVTIGGGPTVEAHTVANDTPGFTGVNTGYVSTTYQLQGTSPFHNTGSTNGTTGGSTCDMGAWGGASIPTQIGCTFGP